MDLNGGQITDNLNKSGRGTFRLTKAALQVKRPFHVLSFENTECGFSVVTSVTMILSSKLLSR